MSLEGHVGLEDLEGLYSGLFALPGLHLEMLNGFECIFTLHHAP